MSSWRPKPQESTPNKFDGKTHANEVKLTDSSSKTQVETSTTQIVRENLQMDGSSLSQTPSPVVSTGNKNNSTSSVDQKTDGKVNIILPKGTKIACLDLEEKPTDAVVSLADDVEVSIPLGTPIVVCNANFIAGKGDCIKGGPLVTVKGGTRILKPSVGGRGVLPKVICADCTFHLPSGTAVKLPQGCSLRIHGSDVAVTFVQDTLAIIG